MNTETHFETLSKYVFAQKITVKKGGFCYQLFDIKNDKVIKIGGFNQDGFNLSFLDGSKSNTVAAITSLYKAIRGENDNMIAFKK